MFHTYLETPISLSDATVEDELFMLWIPESFLGFFEEIIAPLLLLSFSSSSSSSVVEEESSSPSFFFRPLMFDFCNFRGCSTLSTNFETESALPGSLVHPLLLALQSCKRPLRWRRWCGSGGS